MFTFWGGPISSLWGRDVDWCRWFGKTFTIAVAYSFDVTPWFAFPDMINWSTSLSFLDNGQWSNSFLW